MDGLAIAEDIQIFKRIALAAFAFLTWDILITLGQEVEHVWLGPFRTSNILYLFIRYCALWCTASQAFVLSCNPRWLVADSVTLTLLIFSIDIILILRVHAMYSGNKIIAWILAVGFACIIIVLVTVLAISLPVPHFVCNHSRPHPPAIVLAYCMAHAGFETLLFILTLYNFIRAIRDGVAGQTSILSVLTRDGSWAFAVLFAALLGSALLLRFARPPLENAGYPWMTAMIGMAGSRLVLNLRSEFAASEPQISNVSGFVASLGPNSTLRRWRVPSPHPPTSISLSRITMSDAVQESLR